MKTLVSLLASVVCATVFADGPRPLRSLGILFVLDNSGSMQAQTRSLISGLPRFLERLKAQGYEEYRIGLTTTDAFAQKGELVASTDGTTVVSEHSPDPVKSLLGIVDAVKDSPTSFWEQGLESAYQALEKNGAELAFDNSPLAVIYISDENDYSCADQCFGPEPENNKQWKSFPLSRYSAQLKLLQDRRKIEARVYPIVGILEGSCEVASYGVRYLQLRTQIGGLAGSVCRAEFEESLDAIAEDLGNLPAGETVPPKILVNPVRLPEAVAGTAFNTTLTQFVVGSGKLAFSKLSGPAWAAVTSFGSFGGVPRSTDAGVNVHQVNVCNPKGLCAVMTVEVMVRVGNHPPVWVADPVLLPDAKANQAFNFSLREFVADPDGDALICAAQILPAWLVLAPDCTLQGTPRREDLGRFSTSIRVSDGINLTQATVTGSVTE